MNKNYFNKINNSNKAYILGFLCADGSISKKYNKISFCLSCKDIEVLEFIKKELELNTNISKREVYDKRTLKSYCSISLQFSSKIMKSDLKKIGVTYNKSNFLTFPKIPLKYKWDFIRGLFDGDGYISKNKTVLSLISTKEVLDAIGEWNIYRERLSNNTWKAQLTNYLNIYKFRKKLYKSNGFYLKRKKESFNNLEKIEMKKVQANKEVTIELSKDDKNYNFNSIKDAAKWLNCNPSLISNTLANKQKTVRGYTVRRRGESIKRTNRDVGMRVGLDIDG